MAKGKWQMADGFIQFTIVGLMVLMMMGSVRAGESFAVLELFTSQG